MPNFFCEQNLSSTTRLAKFKGYLFPFKKEDCILLAFQLSRFVSGQDQCDQICRFDNFPRVYIVIGKFLNLLTLPTVYAVGHIFNVVNGQIFKK